MQWKSIRQIHRQKLNGRSFGIFVRLYYYIMFDRLRIIEIVGKIRVRGGFTVRSDSGRHEHI
jgi:hypothetical protein